MSASLGKKADDVGTAADELVASDDASGTKATAVARAVSQLLGEASKSGASTHVLQSAMNVADTAGKVIAAKRAKSDNVQTLNESLKADIRALHDALKEEPSRPPAGPTPKKARRLEKPEETAPAEASKSKDKAAKKEKDKKAKKAKDIKKTEEVVEQREVVQHEETRTVQADGPAQETFEPAQDGEPEQYEPVQYEPVQATTYQEAQPSYVQDDFSHHHLPTIVQHADHVDPNLPTQHITVNAHVSAPDSSFMHQSFVGPVRQFAAPAFGSQYQSFSHPMPQQHFGGFMNTFFPQPQFFGSAFGSGFGGPLYVPMIPVGDFAQSLGNNRQGGDF